MSRATWLPDALRAEGLTVGLVDGWNTRGSDDFDGDQPEGILWHHTASFKTSGTHPALGICTYGRSDLPGPLCQVLTPRDGDAFDVYVVASGRANHAGYGGPWATVPVNSGNKYTIGNEVENDGIGEAWSSGLIDRCQRINAAVLKHIDENETRMIGHKEWTSRKIDPHPLTMSTMRAQLKDYLKGDDMPFTEGQLIEFARKGANKTVPNRFWTGAYTWITNGTRPAGEVEAKGYDWAEAQGWVQVGV